MMLLSLFSQHNPDSICFTLNGSVENKYDNFKCEIFLSSGKLPFTQRNFLENHKLHTGYFWGGLKTIGKILTRFSPDIIH